MSNGRRKDTQRGVAPPPPRIEDLKETPRHGVRASKADLDARAEYPAGHIRVIARATGTPIVTAAEARATGARAAGTAAAAVYVEPKTPPPVRQQRSDTVAVMLSDDIDPQKVPTEPSLSRRREPSAWSDIELLPQVKYRSGEGAWHWVLVALFGGIVGYWVYWGAARGSTSRPEPKASVMVQGADSVNPAPPPKKTIGPAPGVMPSGAGTAAALATPESSAAPTSSTASGERSVSKGQGTNASDSTQPAATGVEKKAQPKSKIEPQADRPSGSKPAREPASKPGSEVWLE